MDESQFDVGTQIKYTPDHAKGTPDHPDIEYGFVTSCRYESGVRFVRYWSKGKVGKQIRTTANSEGTNVRGLVPFTSVPNELVVKFLRMIDDNGGWIDNEILSDTSTSEKQEGGK